VKKKKKGRQITSGPSLGRKRPRRATKQEILLRCIKIVLHRTIVKQPNRPNASKFGAKSKILGLSGEKGAATQLKSSK
jgi:hypothetical protein